MMFVKICGLTRAIDADAAVDSGASAVGFIFWPQGRRYLEPEKARAIVRRLPPFVTPVGVFVNETADRINAVADLVGLGAVQLHGDERPELLTALTRPVVKAVSAVDAHTAEEWPAEVMLLVDAHDPAARGGTGARADWDGAARLAAVRPTLLAGGITAANVVEAVSAVRPFGIDVSSGVEDAPGIKSPERIRALFEALRGMSRS
ncbi:MAG TPA: phosphoribosylanthranilate isomerase [Vicinamibacterales bacterium]|nr:phosphoribosylanthranilate isomerase [Vicinamibacterales bacterium]